MIRFTLVGAVVLVTFTHAAFAKGVRDTPNKGKPLSEKEVRSLVKNLVSPNHAPEVGKGLDAEYPANYDRKAQDRVLAAWLTLQACGPRAFPVLFDSFDDERYSLTGEGRACETNWTVGEACRDMIDYELQPYGTWSEDRGDPRRHFPRYFYQFGLNTRDGAKKWWKTHKDKTLRELQIEALEWVIPELKKEKAFDDIRTGLERDLGKLRASKERLEPVEPWGK
jgi:hypothetical protein